MAMTGPAMASAVKALLVADGYVFNAGKPNTILIDDLCAAIVAYIQANAVITVVSVAGVTVGSGVSGPGTGTIA